jgi:GTP pyrophosphokinase
MTNINISVKDTIFEGTIDLYVHHTKDLNNLIMKISNITGIESVKRIEDFSK